MWFPRLRRGKENLEKAEKALEQAKEAVDEVKKQGEAVTAFTNAMRDLGRTNHFAQKLEGIIIRPRGTVNDA